jgi:hypothetical protein
MTVTMVDMATTKEAGDVAAVADEETIAITVATIAAQQG